MKNIIEKAYIEVGEELNIPPKTIKEIFISYLKRIKDEIIQAELEQRYLCVQLPYIGKIKNFIKYEAKKNTKN